VFLFWGAFFAEHSAEWFVHSDKWPPPHVVLLHAVHLAFLLGLLAGWQWELLGGIVVLTAAILFFPAASGGNASLFLLLSVGPAVMWIALGGYAVGRRSLALARMVR
jgi:hypothetical protein